MSQSNFTHTCLVLISQLEGASVTTAKTFLTDALYFGTETSFLGICPKEKYFEMQTKVSVPCKGVR